MMELKDRIKELSKGLYTQMLDWRRHLHENPELSFEEHSTMAYISSILTEIGVDHKTGVAETGIIATIKGQNSETRTVALRADHDALPIQELNEVEYLSLIHI